jgi:hypothetical protein
VFDIVVCAQKWHRWSLAAHCIQYDLVTLHQLQNYVSYMLNAHGDVETTVEKPVETSFTDGIGPTDEYHKNHD